MQTANFVAVLMLLVIDSIEITFDPHFPLANSMSFEPMDFRKPNRTIIEANHATLLELRAAISLRLRLQHRSIRKRLLTTTNRI